MTDDAVARQILKFLRQMNSEDDDLTLVESAIHKAWLLEDGQPTQEGRQLIRSFEDIERVTQQKQ